MRDTPVVLERLVMARAPDERPLPARPESAQRHPEEALRAAQSRPRRRPPKNRQLLPKREVLDEQVAPTPDGHEQLAQRHEEDHAGKSPQRRASIARARLLFSGMAAARREASTRASV